MPSSSRVAVTRDGILIDGKPLYLLAGQLHYFRWPRADWRDLLVQARDAGLNTIDTVIPWNLHEPVEGQFDFNDYADLTGYLDLVHELGLYAIVRPAPYICAEWENGGFPAWLTARLVSLDSSGRSPTGPAQTDRFGRSPTEPALVRATGLPLRTTDPAFVEPTLRWFDRLLPLLAERQIDRGGPIILVQIENEHWASGVYGHDAYQEQQAAWRSRWRRAWPRPGWPIGPWSSWTGSGPACWASTRTARG